MIFPSNDYWPLEACIFGFSNSVGNPFIFFYSFLHCAKTLSLMKSHLVFWLLFSLPEEIYPKRILLRLLSNGILLMFSSWIWMVSGLTFKPFIYFELFSYMVGESSAGLIAYHEWCWIRDLQRRKFNFRTRDQAWSLKSFCVAEFY